MSTYHVYFRSYNCRILGRDEFEAQDDRVAMGIATRLFDACLDMCADFALWEGTRRVDTQPSLRLSSKARKLSENTQQDMLEHELRLRDSDWAIGRSRRLLARLQRLERQRPPD